MSLKHLVILKISCWHKIIPWSFGDYKDVSNLKLPHQVNSKLYPQGEFQITFKYLRQLQLPGNAFQVFLEGLNNMQLASVLAKGQKTCCLSVCYYDFFFVSGWNIYLKKPIQINQLWIQPKAARQIPRFVIKEFMSQWPETHMHSCTPTCIQLLKHRDVLLTT